MTSRCWHVCVGRGRAARRQSPPRWTAPCLRPTRGVHTGEVRLRDEGNYIGPTINRTARLRDLAHGARRCCRARPRRWSSISSHRVSPDRGQRGPLQLQGAGHRVGGASERDDEAVALTLLNRADAVMGGDRPWHPSAARSAPPGAGGPVPPGVTAGVRLCRRGSMSGCSVAWPASATRACAKSTTRCRTCSSGNDIDPVWIRSIARAAKDVSRGSAPNTRTS